jgi:hypothetical protein
VADAGPPRRGQLERWVSFGTTIIAPATILGAVLFYFGYVSARAQYAYFGIDVDTIGLSTRDYVMRSPQPLLVPLLVLTLLGVGVLALHTAMRSRIANATTSEAPTSLTRIRNLVRWATAGGLTVLGVGIALLFAFPYLRDWTAYSLVTPLVIGLGAALFAYGLHLLGVVDEQITGQRAQAREPPSSVVLRRLTQVLMAVVVVASIFWATATVAQWSGRGLAQYDARHLDRLPSIILDTKERLYLTNGCQRPDDPNGGCIAETVLPMSDGQTYRYRYRHFRLLIEGHDRMFLVPDIWSATNSTLVVPLDGSVRIQFQFENQAP